VDSLSFRKQKIQIQYFPKMYLTCNLDMDILLEIMKVVLVEQFNLTVFGYNVMNEEFWGKSITKERILIYFTIQLTYLDENITKLTITPVIGTEKEFYRLILVLREKIYLSYTF